MVLIRLAGSEVRAVVANVTDPSPSWSPAAGAPERALSQVTESVAVGVGLRPLMLMLSTAKASRSRSSPCCRRRSPERSARKGQISKSWWRRSRGVINAKQSFNVA
jgi:hypothetical protein